MISIAEEIAVPSPPDRVWEVISNPADVVSCIAGAELGAPHDDGSFDGTLMVKFGAVRVRFGARLLLELVPEQHEGLLSARGKDGQGATRFNGSATFRVLDGARQGTSLVAVAGEIELSGKLAGLVEAGAGAVVSRMTKEFSVALVARCAEPAAVGVPAPTPEATPDTATAADANGTVAPEHVGASAPQRMPGGVLARLRGWWKRWRTRRQSAPAKSESPVVPFPKDGSW